MGIEGFIKNVGKGAVKGFKDAANTIVDTTEKIADIPGEVKEFASDPLGYVENEISLDRVVHAVSLGLDDVAEGLARKAGLGPLVDGVNAFVSEVSDVVEKLVKLVQCAGWAENPTFWAVSAGIYAGRVSKVIKNKEQCENFVRQGELIDALQIGLDAVLSMLPCAIEAAFLVPLPAPGSTAKVPAKSPGAAAAENIVSAHGHNKIRIPHLPPRPRPLGVVSRSEDKLDIMFIRPDGTPVTAAWEQALGNWRGWWPVANGQASPWSPVSAVSRSKDKLDIFMVLPDRRVWTAAWRPGDKGWRGWWPILDTKTRQGTRVGVVSRSEDKLDVFVTGEDGIIYTAAWEPSFRGWHGWWPVADGRARPGTPVTAVSRSRDKLDIFMVGLDGHVWTTAWEPSSGKWKRWWPIGDMQTLAATVVECVSRSADKLDIFIRGKDHAVYSAAWQPGDRNWRGWWKLS